MYKVKTKLNFGFTLVELLIVITILGVLASIGLVAFTSAQARGRDAKRKSDLKQISSAMEIFYSDYGKYPSVSGGLIQACPYNPATGTGTSCTWGSSEFTDGKTSYFKVLPGDSTSTQKYSYNSVTVNGVPNAGFQVYAHLENSQDPSIISTVISCGASVTCNFGVASPNTTP